MEDKNETTETKQAYVEMTLQKRQQLVEITEGASTVAPGTSS